MEKLILLVDDEQANLFALEVILESNGYQVESCGSGREALELVGTGKYGLVLLDVMMPEMDGYETCRAIRAATDDVPVILVTALSDSEDLERGFDAGAIDYIRKPIDEVELLSRDKKHGEDQRIGGEDQELVFGRHAGPGSRFDDADFHAAATICPGGSPGLLLGVYAID